MQRIPSIVIHRPEDVEREPIIYALEEDLNIHLHRFDAVSGNFLLEQGFPSKHPRDSTPTSAGNIGCTASHIEIMEMALKSHFERWCIFEDDAEFVRVKGHEYLPLNSYLNQIKTLPDADLIFLGVNEIVEGNDVFIIYLCDEEKDGIQQITRFWGTHAVILNKKAMRAIIDVYKESLQNGYALPADWLYSLAIQTRGLVAYAPKKAKIRQTPGLVSLTSGNVRT